MKITVQGRSPQGHSFVVRAGRFWPTGSAKLVDVVEVKAGDYIKMVGKDGKPVAKDGKPVPCVDGDDPPDVVVEVKNPTTGRMDEQIRPDPDRIGTKSYKAICDDSRIVVKQTDTVSQEASEAAVSAARAEVGRLSEENLELKSRVAALESGDALKAALAEVAQLKALVEAATAPDAGKKTKKGDADKA